VPEPSLWVKFGSDVLSQGIAALVGATAGASLAFLIERKKSAEDRVQQEARELKRERDQQALAGMVAMFTLTRMYNTLLNFFRQRIEPVRTDPLLWYKMPPGGEPSLEGIQFDYTALAFLLKSESPSIVLKLDTLADQYRTLADSVRRRSAMHENEILPRLEEIRIPPGTPMQNIEAYLGERLVTSMKNYTDDIRRLVYSALQELPAVGQELYNLLKKRMPEENFIWFGHAIDRDGKPVP
jgi:hypothetical protein